MVMKSFAITLNTWEQGPIEIDIPWILVETLDSWKHVQTGNIVTKEFVSDIWTSRNQERIKAFLENYVDCAKICLIISEKTSEMAEIAAIKYFSDATDIRCQEIVTNEQQQLINQLFKK